MKVTVSATLVNPLAELSSLVMLAEFQGPWWILDKTEYEFDHGQTINLFVR